MPVNTFRNNSTVLLSNKIFIIPTINKIKKIRANGLLNLCRLKKPGNNKI